MDPKVKPGPLWILVQPDFEGGSHKLGQQKWRRLSSILGFRAFEREPLLASKNSDSVGIQIQLHRNTSEDSIVVRCDHREPLGSMQKPLP